MIYYYKPLHVGSYTLSIDNIVLDLWISNPDAKDIIDATINSLICNEEVEICSWKGNKPGTFYNQYLFKLKNETSFWLGHGLISTGISLDRYRLEFNPNKVSENEKFTIIHQLLLKYCRKSLSHIARFDLAIDIPVDRSRCFLVKDYVQRSEC